MDITEEYVNGELKKEITMPSTAPFRLVHCDELSGNGEEVVVSAD